MIIWCNKASLIAIAHVSSIYYYTTLYYNTARIYIYYYTNLLPTNVLLLEVCFLCLLLEVIHKIS